MDWLRIVGFGLLFVVIGVVVALIRANRSKTRRIRELERQVSRDRARIVGLEDRFDEQLDAVCAAFGLADPPRHRRPKLRGINGGRGLVAMLTAAAALTMVATVGAEPVAEFHTPAVGERHSLGRVVDDRDDPDPVRVEPRAPEPRRVDKHTVDDDADEGGAAVDIGRPVVPDREEDVTTPPPLTPVESVDDSPKVRLDLGDVDGIGVTVRIGSHPADVPLIGSAGDVPHRILGTDGR